MSSSSPCAELSATMPSAFIQTFIVVMIILVVVGTVIDVIHEKSLKYFVENWRGSKCQVPKQGSGGEIVSLAAQTLLSEVLTSSEICDPMRRPFEWASTQSGPSNTLGIRGQRQHDDELLQQSILAFDSALQADPGKRGGA